MSSLGETLRRERQRKDLTLDQISRDTKISARLLDAIENDQLDKLPGTVFAKSFVRQYAIRLGLDEDELVAEVEKVIRPVSDVPTFAVSEPAFKVPRMQDWEGSSRSRSSVLPALAGVVAVMFLCSAVYVMWQRSRRPAPTPKATPAVQQPTPQKVEAATAPAPPVEAKPESPASNPETPAESPETPATPVSEAAAAPPENPDATLHVELTSAGEPVWVQAWADDKSVMIATLRPGLMKRVDAVKTIRVRTGNAGDLQMTVNGKPAGELGPKGQIRIVTVNAEGVQSLPPPPKPAAPEPDPLL